MLLLEGRARVAALDKAVIKHGDQAALERLCAASAWLHWQRPARIHLASLACGLVAAHRQIVAVADGDLTFVAPSTFASTSARWILRISALLLISSTVASRYSPAVAGLG